MKVTALSIPDVLLIEPKVFSDERGFFFESFNQGVFEKKTGLSPIFVQENYSKSTKGVLRGLHYQLPPKAQDKLVYVVHGEVFDVVVDIRKNSPTYKQWVGEILTGKNKKQLWIPAGFAHGFFVLSETADFLYKTTNYYDQDYERCILWNDPDIKIDWPTINEPLLADKDRQAELLINTEHF